MGIGQHHIIMKIHRIFNTRSTTIRKKRLITKSFWASLVVFYTRENLAPKNSRSTLGPAERVLFLNLGILLEK